MLDQAEEERSKRRRRNDLDQAEEEQRLATDRHSEDGATADEFTVTHAKKVKKKGKFPKIDTPTVRLSSVLQCISSLLLFEPKNQLFLFQREFNIITRLWVPKEDYIQLVGNSRLLEKFFKEKECIYVSDLEDIFLEYEGDDDDIVKLALVYFIETSLLGKDRRTKVDIGFF
ncbi:Ulp1-like peptidase [Cucumis melo var. makuwa]|uniref:Ulp1-like peptidase n=2 Tax=Cucumis melo TaxID=3656 RepID=A0A5A7T7Q4_CUCMM|nr:Ulp1-like peptidase [Cucumis melo var. makuwa]